MLYTKSRFAFHVPLFATCVLLACGQSPSWAGEKTEGANLFGQDLTENGKSLALTGAELIGSAYFLKTDYKNPDKSPKVIAAEQSLEKAKDGIEAAGIKLAEARGLLTQDRKKQLVEAAEKEFEKANRMWKMDKDTIHLWGNESDRVQLEKDQKRVEELRKKLTDVRALPATSDKAKAEIIAAAEMKLSQARKEAISLTEAIPEIKSRALKISNLRVLASGVLAFDVAQRSYRWLAQDANPTLDSIPQGSSDDAKVYMGNGVKEISHKSGPDNGPARSQDRTSPTQGGAAK